MGNDWEYFAFHKQCKMEFEPFGNKVFHAIVISNPNHIPPVINHICNDRPAYATGDLLIPHPLRTGYWKFLGRKDAQVMLSNGHVVGFNTQTKEQICEHYMITSAVVFGQGRPHLGVILKLDGFSSLQFHKDSIFNIIWEHINVVNKRNPTHCYLAKTMIMCMDDNIPFTYSLKGAPKRSLILQHYQSVIDGLYPSISVDNLYTARDAQVLKSAVLL
ncbi:MAG: hypothetical protein NXY57DRAFT_326732 [Lentinula lateritia]|nr:MAG: hypothetical protein NXY57DRAFT_326732 [Lentinula lateritia]